MEIRDFISQQWARYERLSDREQWLVIGTGIVVMTALFVFVIWEPLHSARAKVVREYAIAKQMQQTLSRYRASNTQNSVPASAQQSLLAIVNETTETRQIQLKRVEPKSNQSLRVWVEQVSFNQIIAWIAQLQKQHGITVETISIDRTDQAGYVNLALVLQRRI